MNIVQEQLLDNMLTELASLIILEEGTKMERYDLALSAKQMINDIADQERNKI